MSGWTKSRSQDYWARSEISKIKTITVAALWPRTRHPYGAFLPFRALCLCLGDNAYTLPPSRRIAVS